MCVIVQVNETIMLSIVSNPTTDYIFVTDFNVLSEHLDNLINQACRTEPPTMPTLPYCELDVTGPTQAPEGNAQSNFIRHIHAR